MSAQRVEDDHDFNFIAHVAMRYAIGRMTYAPSLVTGFIMRHWDAIDRNTQNMMRMELRREMGSGRSMGHRCDEATWNRFLAWMNERLGKDD